MLRSATENGPFRIPATAGTPVQRALLAAFRTPLQKILRLSTLNALYAQTRETSSMDTIPAAATDAIQGPEFLARALAALGISFEIAHGDPGGIPGKGPLVVIANHPFGVVEGLVLARVLLGVRPDVKILANRFLAAIPEMRPLLIELDPFGGAGARARNLCGLRAALGWLRKNGALIIFPAGEVSSLALEKRMVADPPWQRAAAALIRKAQAPALPVFFNGRNSALFQAAGLLHPRLRTLLIPQENLGRHGRTLSLALGAPIPAKRLAKVKTDDALSAYLRFRCHLLRGDSPARPRRPQRAETAAPAAPKPRNQILAEITALPEERVLAAGGEFRVFSALAEEIPTVLHETARLREGTFRRIGEGTGRALDTDRFDAHYRHLILWNARDREVAGAYRFIGTDEALAAFGPRGLYTASQFRIAGDFWKRLGPALELGRSFIRPRYQRTYQPLLLLWRGLAEYVARRPRYRRLFGCVSISGEYRPLSRELIMAFLLRHNSDAELGRFVRPKHAPKPRSLRRIDLRVPEAAFGDTDDLEDLVAELEGGRGIPVLLRQYLKLGGRIAAFNVDPDFGDCLDGLICVDLARTDARTLARFMGAEASRAFLARHAAAAAPRDFHPAVTER